MRGRGTELLIVLLAFVLFVPGLSAVHLFDWDEINFAEIAREMTTTGDYLRPQIDYIPFYEKPPLFMWLQAGAMNIFGVGEFAARLPNAICGMLTLVLLYRIGLRLRNRMFGLLWVLAYVGSVLPNLYFRSGIIDPWFNLFIFLGVHCFILLTWNREKRPQVEWHRGPWRYALFTGIALGIAILAKGPVAFLILGITATAYWITRRFWIYVGIPQALVMVLMMFATTSTWYLLDLLEHGPAFMHGFLVRQLTMFSTEDAGHGGFPGYHFVVLLIGCFPASLFLIHELWKPSRDTEADDDYRRWMVILFWTVLILFSIVQSKIVHYSSLCYFPLTYLAARKLERLISGEEKLPMVIRIGIGAIGSVFAIVTLALPFVGMHAAALKPLFASDAFAQGNLDAQVPWTGVETVAGLCMVLVLFFGHRLFSRGDFSRGIPVVFGGTAIFVSLTLFFFINNIEAYSQRAAIHFFKGLRNERCYAITKNYKSYARLFYARVPPITDERAHDENWLYHGPIDRPVFMVCKITSVDEARAIGTFREIGTENGFVFFRRDP